MGRRYEPRPPRHPRSPESPQTTPELSRSPSGDSQMPPRCLPDASQMPPCSPLTFDVSKVASTRFRVQSDLFIFYVLENDCRHNCKMLSKKGFQWKHKCAKCGQIVKRSMKIKGPNNLRMEMTKQGETQALQSLIFEYPPTQNRNFNLSTFVPNVPQMAPKGTRN